MGGGTGSWDGDRGSREIQAPAEAQPHIDIGTGTGGEMDTGGSAAGRVRGTGDLPGAGSCVSCSSSPF